MAQNELPANMFPLCLLGLSVLVFVFDMVRSKFWESMVKDRLKRDAKPLFCVAGFLAVLTGLAAYLKLDLLTSAPYLFVGLIAVYLTGIIEPTRHRYMRATFLLATGAGLVCLGGENFSQTACAYLAGLLSWKVVSNVLRPDEARLDDVAPVFAYLAALSQQGAVAGRNADLISGAFCVATLLNLMQRPFMKDDKIWLKRGILTIAGGLGMLIVITKGVNAMAYSNMAVLMGAGFGAMYALDAIARMAKKEDVTPAERSIKYVKEVLVIGIFTLLATRLYGNVGLACIAACVLVGSFSQVPACAALFFGSRLLEQAFADAAISNVTGINLQHTYVSAAQYLGFFVIAALIVMTRDSRVLNRDLKVDACALALVATFGTALINFFLHGEPTGSYLVALSAAGVTALILMQSLFADGPGKNEENRSLSIMLVPALASASALLSSQLVRIGADAGMNERMTVLGVLAAVTIMAMMASRLMDKNSGSKSVTVSGE